MYEVETRNGVAYATHDGVVLSGDLYLPRGKGPFPALVAVHGGGWRAGVRGAWQYWGPYLAARGYVLYANSYRLATRDKSTYPQAVQDVRAAVQFVRGNAGGFNIDPERIGIMGASAGANLAALVALAGGETIFAGGYPQDAHAAVSPKVKVLVGVYGVYDLVEMWQRYQVQAPPTDHGIELFMGAPPMADRRTYFEASPISYATFANNQLAVYLAWGTEDDLVDHRAQSEAFLLALKQAGFFVRPCPIAGAPHYWMNDPIDEPGSYTGFLAPRLLRFLAERL